MNDSIETLLKKYLEGPVRVRQALEGLTATELHARPGPGDWSIHELVIHLQDSDGVNIDRMKRVVAEDNPVLIAYDEKKFAANLCYADQTLDDALLLMEIERRQFARVLRQLQPETFARIGQHTEIGSITLHKLLQIAVDHINHHLEFLVQKRTRLGRPAPRK